uniref:Protein of centriole 5 n=1 Tax=Steinernema glaseri TaxID=37863 RepID=A0A1I7Y7I1_9BILA
MSNPHLAVSFLHLCSFDVTGLAWSGCVLLVRSFRSLKPMAAGMDRKEFHSTISASVCSSSKSSNSKADRDCRLSSRAREHQEFNIEHFFYKNLLEAVENNEEKVANLSKELEELESSNERLRQHIRQMKNVWSSQLVEERARYMTLVTLMAGKVERAKANARKGEARKAMKHLERVWNNLLKLKGLQTKAENLERVIDQNSQRTARLWKKMEERNKDTQRSGKSQDTKMKSSASRSLAKSVKNASKK